ncbi:DEAD/DEAH box helicase [Limibacter armeniacum]|uniref:DEAD/DEAH box helicase n=1 Tax=Limibacter armeniacum TaxID=466084 RepID=UPI002FE664E7
MRFDEFELNESLMDGVFSMGFNEATPIQELAIPVILENKDLIACAQTGTGKTAAYLLPTLHKIQEANLDQSRIHTVIIVPTRELALQIDQQLQGFSYFTSVSSIAVYGGGDSGAFSTQRNALKKGADVVVATPGKLISQLRSGGIDFSHMKQLILDEADRMLDMGFLDDILEITSYMPKERQTLLFSATMPPKIRKLASQTLNNPEEINIAISKPAAGVTQGAFLVHDKQKVGIIQFLLQDDDIESTVIFTSTKKAVKEVRDALAKAGLKVEGISSDLDQSEREEVLRLFRAGKVRILVATDVISRGIDIDTIELVINYDVPNDPEDYVHRVGRTARANREGEAITLINTVDQQKFSKIEELIGNEIRKVPNPKEIGEGPEYAPDKRPARRSFPSKNRNNGGSSKHGENKRKYTKKPTHKKPSSHKPKGKSSEN